MGGWRRETEGLEGGVRLVELGGGESRASGRTILDVVQVSKRVL